MKLFLFLFDKKKPLFCFFFLGRKKEGRILSSFPKITNPLFLSMKENKPHASLHEVSKIKNHINNLNLFSSVYNLTLLDCWQYPFCALLSIFNFYRNFIVVVHLIFIGQNKSESKTNRVISSISYISIIYCICKISCS